MFLQKAGYLILSGTLEVILASLKKNKNFKISPLEAVCTTSVVLFSTNGHYGNVR